MVDGEVMGGWCPRTCRSLYGYADEMARAVRDRVPPGSRVLMLGLGGGYLCGMLDDYDMTAVELLPEVIAQARRESFPDMRRCGRRPERATLVCHDAHRITRDHVGADFDALLVDVPSCYEEGRAVAVANALPLLRPGATIVCNVWDRDPPLLRELGHRVAYARQITTPVYTAMRDDDVQYTVVMTKV